MPETPRTVGEDFEAFAIDYCRKQEWLGKDGLPLANADWAHAAHVWVEAHEDALIGCQGRVVYTEENLLAAGHAYEDAHRAALDTNDYEAGLIAGARAAITAAGGVVADRVGYVSKEGSLGCRDREGRHDVLPLLKGDILYIVRAKEEWPAAATLTGGCNIDWRLQD